MLPLCSLPGPLPTADQFEEVVFNEVTGSMNKERTRESTGRRTMRGMKHVLCKWRPPVSNVPLSKFTVMGTVFREMQKVLVGVGSRPHRLPLFI